MLSDIKYALRSLLQNPGFTLTAVLSIAFGVGANGGIFSLADAVLLRPLPVARASEVVSVNTQTMSQNALLRLGSGVWSYQDFVDYRDKNRSFDSLLAYELVPAGFARDANTQAQLKMDFWSPATSFACWGWSRGLAEDFDPMKMKHRRGMP